MNHIALQLNHHSFDRLPKCHVRGSRAPSKNCRSEHRLVRCEEKCIHAETKDNEEIEEKLQENAAM